MTQKYRWQRRGIPIDCGGRVPTSSAGHRTSLRGRFWIVLALAALSPAMQAQTRLRVLVSDATTSEAIGGARVSLRLARVGALTDSLGVAVLTSSRAGLDTVDVRFPGYATVALSTVLRAGETTELAVTLRRDAVTLPTVTVTEKETPREPGLGFNRRQKMGLGHFITRAEIDRHAPTNSADILRRVPGVRVQANRAGDHIVTMTRSTSRCRVHYYVDNMPMPTEELLDAAIEQRITADASANGNGAETRARARSKKLNRDLPAFTIDQIPPEMIEAIEVYRGAAEIPVEYRRTGGSCGVVLIWTKTGA
jgi:hypothetical protein